MVLSHEDGKRLFVAGIGNRISAATPLKSWLSCSPACLRRGGQFHRRTGEVGCGVPSAGLPGREGAGCKRDKPQEIRGFLDKLEGYMGGKAEDLTPKTKLQFYYEHDFVMAAAFEKAEHQSGR